MGVLVPTDSESKSGWGVSSDGVDSSFVARTTADDGFVAWGSNVDESILGRWADEAGELQAP